MAAVSPGERAVTAAQAAMLVFLYVFLYFPVGYIVYVSFQTNSVWPFPPAFTLEHYVRLQSVSDFHIGLRNSLYIGFGSGAIATIFATLGVVGVLKYPTRGRALIVLLYLAPLFVANLLIGISTLMFNRSVLGLPGNLESAILANATYGIAFAYLVLLAQLVRYDWRLDDVAMVFGARPVRTFLEVTLPNVWPAVLGAFLVSFILAFNNLEISFYNLGAVPTLPTIAWGSLRHGVKPELYALASLINAFVFLILLTLYFLIRTGLVRLGVPDR